jgi:predicted Rossmann fold flavoprotein
MAAISAAKNGAEVIVCEQLPKPGRKLMASGGGKCNLSNTLRIGEFMERFGRQGRFMAPALKHMDSSGLRDFFRKRGVPTHAEDGFHYFPVSEKAGDILDVLLKECENLNVKLLFGVKAASLKIDKGELVGFLAEDGCEFVADCVIVATGGKGCPTLGGSGAAYCLAEQAGHSIVRAVPALVGLRTLEKWPCDCSGVSLEEHVQLRINLPRHKKKIYEGELLFTHWGISGPAVIDASGLVNELLLDSDSVPLSLNILPRFDEHSWNRIFAGWRKENGKKQVVGLLSNHFPRSVANAICEQAGIPADLKAAELSALQLRKLSSLLLSLPLIVNGSDGFKKAMLTRGGVSLKKVNPDTLESRLLKGLYFVGEALDLDGPCGGYNLQWAFSSGNLAGKSASNA